MKVIVKRLAEFSDGVRKNGLVRGFRASYLARLCEPGTVWDIGVGYGTPELYKAYPKAKLVLVEPLTEYGAALAKLSESRDCTIVQKAAGRQVGKAIIDVNVADLQKTSFRRRAVPRADNDSLCTRTIQVTTLDGILEEHPKLKRPFALKIDVEGHELDVIAGATNLFRSTELVIAEVSVARRFENGYRFEDLVAAMKAHGFGVFDFLRLRYLKNAPGTRFADVAFKRIECEP